MSSPAVSRTVDILVVGAGPVGLLSSFLTTNLGLKVLAIDKSDGPLKLGRADAMNARTLQLLQTLQSGIFDELYPQGLICNTSSTFKDGQFASRQSKWWEALAGCEHRHFLMLGQPYVEDILDRRLQELGNPVQRNTTVTKIWTSPDDIAVFATLLRNDGEEEVIQTKYLIGADGSHSFVRKALEIEFEGEGIDMTWAVIDCETETTFPNVPEIINFQVETSDVARIPREGKINRYYVHMDSRDFTTEDAIAKIERALQPHPIKFTRIEWASQFTGAYLTCAPPLPDNPHVEKVQERIAKQFVCKNRVFLAGDAGHVHSVNGGQGLNTGLMDAFNLSWKIYLHAQGLANDTILQSYEQERRPVAQTVIETAGKLVRATKYARGLAPDSKEAWNHAAEYVRLIEQNSRYITGMGISYAERGSSVVSSVVTAPSTTATYMYGAPLVGFRAFDFTLRPVGNDATAKRLYTSLPYDGRFTTLVFVHSTTANLDAVSAFLSTLEEDATASPVLRGSRVWLVRSASAASTHDEVTIPASNSLDVSSFAEVVAENARPDTVGCKLYAAALALDGSENAVEPFFVVVRPDMYVACAGLLSDASRIREFVRGLCV